MPNKTFPQKEVPQLSKDIEKKVGKGKKELFSALQVFFS